MKIGDLVRFNDGFSERIMITLGRGRPTSFANLGIVIAFDEYEYPIVFWQDPRLNGFSYAYVEVISENR
tara:strand:- start:43 stop:249 length:207 start_codon:yes stop_codon:yes gene_type:complete